MTHHDRVIDIKNGVTILIEIRAHPCRSPRFGESRAALARPSSRVDLGSTAKGGATEDAISDATWEGSAKTGNAGAKGTHENFGDEPRGFGLGLGPRRNRGLSRSRRQQKSRRRFRRRLVQGQKAYDSTA